jgi:hypothetical protein
MVCENAQWAKVHWVDVSGNKGSFYTEHLPVFYELVSNGFIGGQCPNVQYKVVIEGIGATTHSGWQAWGCGVTVQWRSVAVTGKIKGIIEKSGNLIWIQYTHPSLGDAEKIFAIDNNQSHQVRWFPYCFKTSAPYFVLQGSAKIINIIRVDGLPDNCGNLPAPCDLKITDSRGLIYQKAFDNACPTVTVECSDERCPPGTCEVDCHGHKCCYNAQGNVVKVIGG